MTLSLIRPSWPIQEKVQAFTTTRAGGVSQPPYNDLNLALHVDDNVSDVQNNRQQLCRLISPETEIKWLKQIHSNKVVNASNVEPDVVEADAAFTTEKNIACAVLTADCLPILISDKNGECVAAVHAGWRGVLNGVISNTIQAMSEFARPEYAWFGPAIGAQAFEVGEDVYSEFVQSNLAFAECFRPKVVDQEKPGKWNLNIYKAAKIVLNSAGISNIFGGEFCTFSDTDQFFSYRRQNVTGRMATIIAKR